MQINYLIFDKETTALVQSRAAANQPLMQAGDTVGVILKATPNAGTKTGAGGYSTFFVPVGSQIVGAEYGVVQDNGTFQPLSMKGQSPLVHGQGPIDVQAPVDLAGYTIGPNVLGISALSVDLKCIPWGTLAGLYGDTGIFYSTDPDTAWRTFETSGGFDGNPATKYLNFGENNSGFFVVPGSGRSIIDSFQLTTANDADVRDPATWQIHGMDDTGVWSLLGSGSVTLPVARGAAGPIVTFSNTTICRAYRMT
jgi:hypothetical protein